MSLQPQWENNFIAKGLFRVGGIDEAGRGAWAGPVVSACVVFNPQVDVSGFKVNDSKLLSPSQREKVFAWLIANFDYGVGVVDNTVIDDIGILPATRRAMTQAVSSLNVSPDQLLIDAVDLSKELSVSQQSLVKGDQKVWSIAAASIIAKVTRDRLMIDFHRDYNQYGFDCHKGYGTKLHRQMICRHGVCPLHRLSYRPIKEALN